MLLELLIFLFCDLIHNHHTAKLKLQPCIGIKCSVEFNLLPFFRLYIASILLDLICNHLAKLIYFETSYVIKKKCQEHLMIIVKVIVTMSIYNFPIELHDIFQAAPPAPRPRQC